MPDGIVIEPRLEYGILFAWHQTDRLLFINDIENDPTLITYALDSGNVENFQIPNFSGWQTPALNPRGDLIAFRKFFGGELVVFDLVQREDVLSTNGTNPAFLPDGKRLSVWRDSELILIDLETKIEEIIFRISGDLWPEELAFPYATEWSPTDEVVAFVYVSSDTEVAKVVLLDLRTEEARPIINLPDETYNLSWSPDGRIYYICGR